MAGGIAADAAVEPIADPGYGLDGEIRSSLAGDPAQLRDRPIDGIVPDNPAAPAGADQILTRYHRAVRVGEDEKHLHDLGLYREAATGSLDGAGRGPDGRVRERKIPAMGERDRRRAFLANRHCVASSSPR